MNVIKEGRDYLIKFNQDVDVSLMNCYRRLLAQKAYAYGVTNVLIHEYHHHMPLDWFKHRICCLPFPSSETIDINVKEGAFVLQNTLITTLREGECIKMEVTVGELERYQAEAIVFNPSLDSNKKILTIESLVDFPIDEIVKKRIFEVTKEIQTILEGLKISF